MTCKAVYQFRVLTGGRDAKVQIMDRSLELIMTVNVGEARFGSLSGAVRSIALSSDKTNLLIGTLGGEIYEVVMNGIGKSISRVNTLMQSHYSPSMKV